MKDWPTISEMTVMKILHDNPAGMYERQLVHASGGAIKPGSVYVLLERLEEKGFVKPDKPQAEKDYPGRQRPIYRLTTQGGEVVRAAETIGLRITRARTPTMRRRLSAEVGCSLQGSPTVS